MFPLKAKKNGVLERNGYTEATVDLLRLAGLKECGLCCEVMREDGTMMRTPELIELAKKYDMKFITIKGLQDYRKRHENWWTAKQQSTFPTKYGSFYGYKPSQRRAPHRPGKGDIGDGKDLLCRVHSECMTGDTFGSLRCDCGDQLAAAMTQIEKEAEASSSTCAREAEGSVSPISSYELKGPTPWTSIFGFRFAFRDLREYYIGAQILRDLGAKELRLQTKQSGQDLSA